MRYKKSTLQIGKKCIHSPFTRVAYRCCVASNLSHMYEMDQNHPQSRNRTLCSACRGVVFTCSTHHLAYFVLYYVKNERAVRKLSIERKRSERPKEALARGDLEGLAAPALGVGDGLNEVDDRFGRGLALPGGSVRRVNEGAVGAGVSELRFRAGGCGKCAANGDFLTHSHGLPSYGLSPHPSGEGDDISTITLKLSLSK